MKPHAILMLDKAATLLGVAAQRDPYVREAQDIIKELAMEEIYGPDYKAKMSCSEGGGSENTEK